MLHILNEQNSILNKFIAEMRDRQIQVDSMRFRRNLERMGEVTAYEISKTLDYPAKIVETPLGEASVMQVSDQVVVATILRAGLPYHQGFLNYFDNAQNAFIGASRAGHSFGRSVLAFESANHLSLYGARLMKAAVGGVKESRSVNDA